ncbi:MAG: radical SAM protein [Bacteroidaceae bacterium]|nr:radical SAM protein [Bacteroidaceae bacterium]
MGLTDYTSLLKITGRVVSHTTPRLLWKFVRNFGLRNLKNMSSFERRMKNGEPFFPAFMMISVTEACNLACSGCWVSRGGKMSLTPEQLDGIITQSKSQGSYFFGILGGEPLMYRGLFEVLEKHPDCYFQIFTNATLITPELAQRMRKLGNVTPLISIEGLREESDRRRGKDDVYERTLRGLRACRESKLIFGVAASICKSNFDELVSRQHLENLAREGAAFMWYYIYRPVGADARPENALSKEQVRQLRQFIVEQRRNAPLIIIDVYWGADGKAICPGATGMSHHISPSGYVEFCPPLQMAMERLNADGSNLVEICRDSQYLADLRQLTSSTTRGCILMEAPEKLADFIEEHGGFETTSRATFLEELKRMRQVPGHDMHDEAIPEKSPLYRMLQKRYFFGFGAYG